MNAVAALDQLISDFHNAGRPRVWSLVITVFGDAVQPRGGRISAARLQAVLGRLGVEAGAVRTAMSRLVKEGWVQRERMGRASYYRLSDTGRAAFEPATDRIYRAIMKPDDTAITLGVLVGGNGEARLAADRVVAARGGRVLAAGNYLWKTKEVPPEAWLVKQGILAVQGSVCAIPESLFQGAEMAAQRMDYVAFREAFSKFTTAGVETLGPLDGYAVRVMLVHYWRRIVLRYPDLPDGLAPKDWPALACHERVCALYRGVLGPSETWLDHAPSLEDLPHPEAGFYQRFGGLS